MPTADRPLSALLHDIFGNVQDIVRSEMRLAKTELTEELGKSRAAAMLLGAGALLLTLSLVFVLLAVVYALSTVLAAWAAALIVGAAVGLVAAVCVSAGLKRFRSVRAVPRTTASLKENVEWAKQLSR